MVLQCAYGKISADEDVDVARAGPCGESHLEAYPSTVKKLRISAALAVFVFWERRIKKESQLLEEKVHPGNLARGCFDLKMTWLLCCAGGLAFIEKNSPDLCNIVLLSQPTPQWSSWISSNTVSCTFTYLTWQFIIFTIFTITACIFSYSLSSSFWTQDLALQLILSSIDHFLSYRTDTTNSRTI